MKRLCVFCGSNHGASSRYQEITIELGQLLAHARIALVYGGGSVGLMGVLADSVLAAGGEVIGVIPRALWDREVGHAALTELHIVGSMHERKALMADLSDGFLALPGGIGTMDELFEIWTWRQLGIHAKPLGLLSVDGFYRPLIELVDHLTAEGFLAPATRELLITGDQPSELLGRLVALSSNPNPAPPFP